MNTSQIAVQEKIRKFIIAILLQNNNVRYKSYAPHSEQIEFKLPPYLTFIISRESFSFYDESKDFSKTYNGSFSSVYDIAIKSLEDQKIEVIEKAEELRQFIWETDGQVYR